MRRTLLFAMAASVLALAQPGCRDRRGATAEAIAEAVVAQALRGVGERGRFAFELRLEPEAPGLGELFGVETEVRDARTGAPVEGARFLLDATMPGHRHGMLTMPVHRELAAGRYRSDGMKLHMAGAWLFRAEVQTADGHADIIELAYAQHPGARR